MSTNTTRKMQYNLGRTSNKDEVICHNYAKRHYDCVTEACNVVVDALKPNEKYTPN